MGRGKDTSDDIKEKAIAMLLTGSSLSEVSKALKVPKSTIAVWKNKDNETNDKIGRLRTEKKMEWANKAWNVVGLGTTLLERRLKRAVEQEDEIDELIDNTLDAIEHDADLTSVQKHNKYVAVSSKISALKIDDINKIAVTVGTMYDKTALAQGEATESVKMSGTLTLEQVLADAAAKKDIEY